MLSKYARDGWAAYLAVQLSTRRCCLPLQPLDTGVHRVCEALNDGCKARSDLVAC